MATAFGVALVDAIKNKEIVVNFQGVTLGDSWVDPISFVNAWPDYLLATSEIDNVGYSKAMTAVDKCAQAVAQGQWKLATQLWGDVENVITSVSDFVDWYNILNRNGGDFRTLQEKLLKLEASLADPLDTLMNGPIRKSWELFRRR